MVSIAAAEFDGWPDCGLSLTEGLEERSAGLLILVLLESNECGAKMSMSAGPVETATAPVGELGAGPGTDVAEPDVPAAASAVGSCFFRWLSRNASTEDDGPEDVEEEEEERGSNGLEKENSEPEEPLAATPFMLVDAEAAFRPAELRANSAEPSTESAGASTQ